VETPSDTREGVWDRLRLEGGMLLSLPDEGWGWILKAAARARALVAQLQPDAVVSTGPPHSAHVVAWLATRGFRTRWLADFRDPWAGPVAEAWRESPLYRSALGRWFTRRVEQLVLKSVNAALCNTREFAAALAARYSRQAVHWVPNAVDRDLLPSPDPCLFPGLAVAYVGTLYGGRDLGPVPRALRVVLDRHPEIDGKASMLRIAGSIEQQHVQTFRRDVDALCLRDHVEFFGVLSRDAALALLARSRLGVVLAQKQDLQIPAKLYELLGIGIPTVVIAAAGSAAYSEALPGWCGSGRTGRRRDAPQADGGCVGGTGGAQRDRCRATRLPPLGLASRRAVGAVAPPNRVTRSAPPCWRACIPPRRVGLPPPPPGEPRRDR